MIFFYIRMMKLKCFGLKKIVAGIEMHAPRRCAVKQQPCDHRLVLSLGAKA